MLEDQTGQDGAQHISASPLEQGTLVNNRYRINRLLGSGGSGFAVLAHDLQFGDEPVVLKFLHTHLIQDERAFTRFRQETAVAYELAHPNIVQTYSFESWEDECYFMTMEYLPNGCLRDCIPEFSGPALDFPKLLSLLNMVVNGLNYAHNRGVVHRDIKPHNLLLNAEGVVKIADFGLSQLMWGEAAVTRVGDVVGTPQYMSPEQLESQALDCRSDIYSLGIMAFELAAGKVPFEGRTLYELAQLHLSSPLPDVRQYCAVPDWYQELLERCTAKQREQRYQSVEELASHLRHHLGEQWIEISNANVSYRSRTDEVGQELRKEFGSKVARSSIFNFLFLMIVALTIYCHKHAPLQREIATVFYRIERQTGIELPMFKKLFGITSKYGDTSGFFMDWVEKNRVWTQLWAGLNPNFTGPNGMTPLQWRAKKDVSYEIDHILILLKHGANVEVRDALGRTAFSYCIEHVWEECAKTLFKAGADINTRDNFQRTPMHHAVLANSPKMLEFLARHGAELNPKDSAGDTPLHYAVRAASPLLVQTLVNIKADPQIANHKGFSPIIELAILPPSENSRIISDLLSVRMEWKTSDQVTNRQIRTPQPAVKQDIKKDL